MFGFVVDGIPTVVLHTVSRNDAFCLVDRTLAIFCFVHTCGLGGTYFLFLYHMPVAVPSVRGSLR